MMIAGSGNSKNTQFIKIVKHYEPLCFKILRAESFVLLHFLHGVFATSPQKIQRLLYFRAFCIVDKR